MIVLELPPKTPGLWLPPKPALIRSASDADVRRAAAAAQGVKRAKKATFPFPFFVPESAAAPLYIAVFNCAVTTITLPGGWTSLHNTNNTTLSGAAFYFEGTPANLTVSTSGSVKSTWQILKISGFESGTAPSISTVVVGASSTTPNPTSVTAAWGSEANLYLVLAGHWNGGSDSGNKLSSGPSGYTTVLALGTTGVSNAGTYTFSLNETSSSNDPGNITYTNSQRNVVVTAAVKPAQAGVYAAVDATSSGDNDTATTSHVMTLP